MPLLVTSPKSPSPKVARKEDGTVVKKTFKPIEDSGRISERVRYYSSSDIISLEIISQKFHLILCLQETRQNTFVLSKNREERVQWEMMEVVVIIDR